MDETGGINFNVVGERGQGESDDIKKGFVNCEGLYHRLRDQIAHEPSNRKWGVILHLH